MHITFDQDNKNFAINDADTVFFIAKMLNPNYSRKRGSTEPKWKFFVDSATKIVKLPGKTLCTKPGLTNTFYVTGATYETEKAANKAFAEFTKKNEEKKMKKAE